MRDAEFARLFFGIWLSPRTSEPALREALLGPARPMTTLAAPAGAGMARWRRACATARSGLPLAFVALPLYVVLPNHYASEFGVPLATLGALLLGARLLDAVADPWIGRWVDRWFAHSVQRGAGWWPWPRRWCSRWASAACSSRRTRERTPLLVWCAALLAVTYLSYSVLSVLHQAWGARLGGDEGQRARIVSWREGLALLGVLVASVLPSVAGLGVTGAVFTLTLALGVWLLSRAPRPAATPDHRGADERSRCAPRRSGACWLVFLVNGVASAVPATLVLFFIRDRLQAPAWEPLFLASYFAAGALSMPLWVRAVAKIRPGARLARRHAAGHHHLRLGGHAGRGRRGRLHDRVRRQRHGPGRRPDAARRDARRRDPARRPRRPARGRLLRLVELRHQAQPGAGRRRRTAAACRCSATRPANATPTRCRR